MTDSEVKYPLRKFADDTELSSGIDTTEGKGAIQGDLHSFGSGPMRLSQS